MCSPAGAADAFPYNLTCEVFGVPDGLYGASATASPLHNPRFSLFNAMLVNVLGWGDTYMQTSWCGSGGLVATILAPNNEVRLRTDRQHRTGVRIKPGVASTVCLP